MKVNSFKFNFCAQGYMASHFVFQDANCGNTLLISLEELVKDGLLEKHELPEPM